MQNSPLISIIIPTYNRGYLISETLDSIMGQSYINWECIIVDDGSNDNTEEIVRNYIKKDNRFFFYHRPISKFKGANACRNFGFQKSRGKYINWFDSDDLMHQDKLRRQCEQLEKSNSFDFTVCQTLLFKDKITNTFGLRKDSIYSENFFEDFVTHKIKWLTMAPLFKKDFLIQNNLTFDENLHQSQERDFFVKVLNIIDDYNIDKKPLVYFRIHPNSISHGRVNEEKLKSNFLVNLRILEEYSYRLSDKTKGKLIVYLKQVLLKSLKVNNLKLQYFFFKKVFFKISSNREKCSFFLGFLSIKFFNKGYILFK